MTNRSNSWWAMMTCNQLQGTREPTPDNQEPPPGNQGTLTPGNQKTTPENQGPNFREAWNPTPGNQNKIPGNQNSMEQETIPRTMKQLQATRIYLLPWSEDIKSIVGSEDRDYSLIPRTCLTIVKTRTISQGPLKLGPRVTCYSEDQDHPTIPLGLKIGWLTPIVH